MKQQASPHHHQEIIRYPKKTNACRFPLAILAALAVCACQSAAEGAVADGAAAANYDIRLENSAVAAENAAAVKTAVTAQRNAALTQLRAETPDLSVSFDAALGTPKFVRSPSRFLTGAGDPAAWRAALKAYVASHAALFGIEPMLLDACRVSRNFVTKHNGVRAVTLQQQVNGADLMGAELRANFTRDGALINISSTLVPIAPGIEEAEYGPLLSAEQAVRAAALSVGIPANEPLIQLAGAAANADGKITFAQNANFAGAVTARRVYFPLIRQTARPAWLVTAPEIGPGNVYEAIVDAGDERVLWRRNLTEYDTASYLVYASDSPAPWSPTTATVGLGQQPPYAGRTTVTLEALDTTASPAGWIDPAWNETRGNNVDAHLDLNGNNVADTPRPAGGAAREFAFPLTLPEDAPADYRDATVTQLFYWNNVAHDRLYQLGFDEAAGNFQNDNFGRGGLGADAVQADAQDGSGTNNANFYTPADGSPGRMQMFVFTGPDPDRDSALDAEIVIHEYVHGLSNRLHGGLAARQSRGLGEGWSDFYALCLLAEPGDDPRGDYVMGGYTTRDFYGLVDNYYFGIRRFPYATDRSVNPATFADIDPRQISFPPGIPQNPVLGGGADEVHNVGEVWCQLLWACRARLLEKHGFTGNELMLQLVTDGMKLSPGNPSFTDARDAILLADVVNNGGVNLRELWTGFAERGLGQSAFTPNSGSCYNTIEAFDTPFAGRLVVTPETAFEPNGFPGGPFHPTGPKTYAIANTSTPPLHWTAAASADWVTLSDTAGTVTFGTSTTVQVSINSLATSFPLGTYRATVTFRNTESPEVEGRRVELDVVALTPLPHFEDFDAQTTTHTLKNEWSDDFDWVHHSGSTPNAGTGPSGDHTSGGGKYLYLETHGRRDPGLFGVVTTPYYDLSGATAPRLSFWHHMYGAEMGRLEVQASTDMGASWSPALWSRSGDRGDVWRPAEVDLAPYLGEIVTFQFIGATSDSRTNDMALDDVYVYDPPNTTPAVHGLRPAAGATLIGAEQEIDVWFSEPVVGVDVTDMEPSGTAAANANVTSATDLGDNVWRFTIEGLVEGELEIALAPDPDDLEDAWGNNLAPRPVQWSYSVILHEASLPFFEDFEKGAFDHFWYRRSTETGETTATLGGGAKHGGDYHAVLSNESSATLGLNELILTVNLAGYTGVLLDFWCKDLGDETHSMPASGSYRYSHNGDGLSISADGVEWHPLDTFDGTNTPDLVYRRQTYDLHAAILNADIDYETDFRIKFQQYGRKVPGADGYAFDDISISGDAAAPPSLLYQPTSKTVNLGEPADFSVAATGSAPLRYQWRKNGSALSDGGRISGARAASLQLGSARKSDVAEYTCLVTNTTGSVASAPAVLAVNDADLGDAPDPRHPTLLDNNGARHALGALFLGAGVDAEPDGQPDAAALGDDGDGGDDEDGVRFLEPLSPGLSVDVEVTASRAGKLDAWIDYNTDGDWRDAGERVFASQALTTGVNSLSVAVPAAAEYTDRTFARFRLSGAGGLGFDGGAADGEVEDYAVALVLPAPVLDGLPSEAPGLSRTISWSAPPGAQEYFAERDEDAGFGSVDDVSGWTSRRSQLFEGLTWGVRYHYRVKARRFVNALSESWTQTSQSDFADPGNLASDVDTATNPGGVRLATIAGGAEFSGVIANPSFEDGLTSWTPGGNIDATSLSFATTAGARLSMPTAGSNYCEGFIQEFGEVSSGGFRSLSQTIDIAGVQELSFDAEIFAGGAGHGDLRGEVRIGDAVYWSETLEQPHLGLALDVSPLMGQQTLELRVQTYDDASDAEHRVYFDNFRTVAREGYVTRGAFISKPLAPEPFVKWGALTFDATTPAGTAVTVDVLDAAGGLLAAGVASGAELDALGIAASTIRLRANLSTGDVYFTPTLNAWTVSWFTTADGFIESGWSNVESCRQRAGAAIYVSPTGAGDGSGADWANAATLQDALTGGGNQALMMLEGTYLLSANLPPIALYNFEIYGGFTTGELLPGDRTGAYWSDHPTIIDGRGLYRMLSPTSNAGDIILDGVTLQNAANPSGTGGAIFLNSNGCTLELTHCRFINNRARDGGAIDFRTSSGAGSLRATSCTFQVNRASYSGGAIITNVDIELSDCVFEDNIAPQDGGAIWSTADARCTDCVFEGNTATRDGGAVWSTADARYTDCVFEGNTAGPWGGNPGTLSSFGGHLSHQLGVVWVIRGQFNRGLSYGHGGAIYSKDGELHLTDSVFLENESRNFTGGGIYLQNGLFEAVNTEFTSNTCKAEGAVLHLYAASGSVLTGCTFTGNATLGFEAWSRGGAAYFYGCAPITFTSCIFARNKAESYGGAVCAKGSRTGFLNCLFANNQSGYDANVGSTMTPGGAVALIDGADGVFSNCTFDGNDDLLGDADGIYASDSYDPNNGFQCVNSIFTNHAGLAIRSLNGAGGSARDNLFHNHPAENNVETGSNFTLGAFITDDPLFAPGGYVPQSDSPVYNAGHAYHLTVDGGNYSWDTPDYDLAGRSRIGHAPDLGAYEVDASSVRLNPSMVDFGRVAEGAPRTMSVNVEALGNLPVRVTSATVAGPHFSITGVTPDLGGEIAPGQPGTVAVTFTPPITGLELEYTGVLTVVSDADNSPSTAGLTAIGFEFIPPDPDPTTPSFSGLAVTPALAWEGTTVTLIFTASEALAGRPVVTVNGHPASYVRQNGPHYTYQYVVLTSDPWGDARISISGANPAGNVGVATNSTLLDVLAGRSLPWYENFDGAGYDLRNATDDRGNWTQKSGYTPTYGTGPGGDRTTGRGKYIYFDSYREDSNEPASVTTPYFDLRGASSPTLTFWHHMYGQNMGSIDVRVSTDMSATWSAPLWSLAGNQGDVWRLATVDLSAYIGERITLRFTGTTGYPRQYSDMALDDIQVDDPPLTDPEALLAFSATGAVSTLAGWDAELDVRFSKPVFGVDPSDLILSGSAAAAGARVTTVTQQSTDTWRFVVAELIDEGTLNLTLAPDPDDIEDAWGRDLTPRPTEWSFPVVKNYTTVPFFEGFETGALAPFWGIGSSDSKGLVYVTPKPSTHGGAYNLRMARGSNAWGLNELILTVDLAGLSGVTLDFWWRSLNDWTQAMPTSGTFDGQFNGDGVSVSADGETWHVLETLDSSSVSQGVYYNHTLDLDRAILTANVTYETNFKIKFQHYGNRPTHSDGVTFDDISLTAIEGVAPSLLYNPTSRTAHLAEPASFSVATSGTAPILYEWRKDGVALRNGGAVSGADATTLTISSVRESDEGLYSCWVRNTVSDVLSRTAALTVRDADLGDAPDPRFPTLLSANGARHSVGPLYLGAGVDAEPDGQPDANALGDNDDGVRFLGPLSPGMSVDVEVTASGAGRLDAWIDYNHDDDWLDPGERIFTSQALTTGVNTLSVAVPAVADYTDQTYARFRLSSAGGLAFDGLAVDGEVEDYAVALVLTAPVLDAEPPLTPGTANAISWSAPVGAQEYFAERDEDAGFGAADDVSGWTPLLAHEFAGLSDGQTNHFRVKARRWVTALGGSWTQTSQSDFEDPENTALHVDTATTPGCVQLWTTYEYAPLYDVIANPSLEDELTGWVLAGNVDETTMSFILMNDEFPWYEMPTAGHHYLLGWISDLDGISSGSYCSLSQDVNLTGVKHLRFDAALTVQYSIPPDLLMGLRIDGAYYWRPTQRGSYRSVTLDVSALTGTHTLELFMQAPDDGPYLYQQGVLYDNFRASARAGYRARGTFVSKPITPHPFAKWGALTFDAATPASTTLTVDVLDAAGDLLAADVAPGADLDALGITTSTIKLRANLSTLDVSITPVLNDWSVSHYATLDRHVESAWSNVEFSTQDATSPTCVVTAPASPVTSGPLAFTIEFSEPVTGLTADALAVTGGAKGALTGDGAGPYTLPVTPGGVQGVVTCRVPADAAQDVVGQGNLESNTAAANYNYPTTPFFPVDPTGSSQPILIVEAYIGDEPVEVGQDWVSIFDGELCVGASRLTAIPMATTTTAALEVSLPGGGVLPGARPGNRVSFQLYDASTDRYFAAIPTVVSGADPPVFAEGAALIVRLDTQARQEISLREGLLEWVSFNVELLSADAAEVFGALGNLVIVQSQGGEVYIPPNVVFPGHPGSDTLSPLSVARAYQLFIGGAGSQDLIVTGTALVDPTAILLDLAPNQLHWIPCPYQAPAPIANVFNATSAPDLWPHLVIVQDETGGVLIPPNVVFPGHPGSNTIGELRPGEGYKLFHSSAAPVAFRYLAEDAVSSGSAAPAAAPVAEIVEGVGRIQVASLRDVPRHFAAVRPTNKSQPVFITSATIDGVALQPGDEIGIFDDGLCVGVLAVESLPSENPAVAHLTHRPPFSAALPGARADFPMRFVAWDASAGAEIELEIDTVATGGAVFQEAGVVAIGLKGATP